MKWFSGIIIIIIITLFIIMIFKTSSWHPSLCSMHKEHALASKTFQFDGSGHVIMRPLNEVSLESIIVSLTFKSFWGNSFLFGSVDDSTVGRLSGLNLLTRQLLL